LAVKVNSIEYNKDGSIKIESEFIDKKDLSFSQGGKIKNTNS